MSNSLLEHLSAINDLVEDVLKENHFLRNCIRDQPGKNRKKLTKNDVKRVREMKRNGCTQADIADCFDVHPATISRIVRGIYH